MDEIVDHALYTYGLTRELDATRSAQSERKIIDISTSSGAAGQNDTQSVGILCAGVPERMHEGPDPRFTGC